MPDRPSFPVPDDLTPETFCLCLQIPNDPTWKTVIAGLLFQPAEWFNWQRDDDRSGKILAHYWRTLYNEIDWSTMSCCCNNQPIVIIQISPSGEVEVSDDGGATYTPAPEQDPRNAVPRLPPVLPPDTPDEKCTYSDSVVALFKEGVIDVLEEASTVQEIIAIITGILAGVLGFAGGVLTFVGAVIAVLANGIFALGVTLVQAAFTESFWNDLRCLIYNNINADGSFSQGQLDAIYAGMSGDPIAVFITQNWLAALGTAGMTNSARAGYGSADADCDCTEACAVWEVMGASHGTIVDFGEDFVTVEASNAGGNYYVIIHSVPSSDCYVIVSSELISGSAPTLIGWTDCGTEPVEGVPQHTGVFGYNDMCVNYFQQQGAGAFTVKITFAPCAP